MEINVTDLLIRYLEQSHDDSAQYRTLLTAALFFNHSVLELLNAGKNVDTTLIQDIAALASPIELAVMLEGIGHSLPAETFSLLFQQAFNNTTDIRALRELGLAVRHYHEYQQNDFQPPPELAERLLNSRDEDARVVGLKVLRRYYRDTKLFYQHAVQALTNGSAGERTGATYELTQAMDEPNHRFLSALDEKSIMELREKLDNASRTDPDYSARQNATNALKLLGYYDEDRSANV